MSLLKPVVVLDVMQVIESDNSGSVHLHLGEDVLGKTREILENKILVTFKLTAGKL